MGHRSPLVSSHPCQSRGIRRRKRLAGDFQEVAQILPRHGWLGGRPRTGLSDRSDRRNQGEVSHPLPGCPLHLRLDFRHHVLHPPKTAWILLHRRKARVHLQRQGILGPDRPRYWPGRQHVLLRRWTGRTVLSLPRFLQRLGFYRIIQARYHQRTRQGTQNPPHAGRISRSSQPQGTRCRLALFEQ